MNLRYDLSILLHHCRSVIAEVFGECVIVFLIGHIILHEETESLSGKGKVIVSDGLALHHVGVLG